jgi:DNA mismatch repair protein MutL
MGNIRILPEKVANQIAAGEVIERPASVVRELVDNSIDAGAERINIYIEEGGKKLIRVSDNGSGMNKDDILLSLERHATSKITSIEDIFSINTLGFRGEALPSICSVSRTIITSRVSGELTGHRLTASGGKPESIEEIGAPVGTTIEVRDIYFNTPARRKFLKAVKTETGHIIDVLSRILLPFNHIQARLDDKNKTLLNLPSSDNLLNRLLALFGRDVATSLIDSGSDKDGIGTRVYLAPPDLNRSRGDRIYIYINNRNIKDKIITRAIMEGYGQRLMKGRYPQAVIFMEIDPSLVDINVHPAKQEVRFHEGRMIYQVITSTIERALREQIVSLPNISYGKGDVLREKQVPPDKTAEPMWEYVKEVEKIDGIPAQKEIVQRSLINETPQVIGQLKNTYLLFQAVDGLIVLDQHAAHERILYETLKKNYLSSKVVSQAFLIPVRLELSSKESRTLIEKLDQIASFGFELEHFGGNTFLLRSVPSVLVNVEYENFLMDLIPLLDEEGDLTSDKAVEKVMTVMACHGAIRAGQKMSHGEISLLLEQLEDMDLPTNCPHGRPIYRKISYHEIEKMFKRVV